MAGRAGQLRSAFDDLVRVETRLYNELNDRLRRACGITMSQYEFLDHVSRRPAARVADLAAAFAVGLGATSKGVDRLAAAGWVRREPNPDDGRSSLLRLTDAGGDLVARAGVVVDETLDELMGPGVSPRELDRVGAVLHRWRTALETARVGTPAG